MYAHTHELYGTRTRKDTRAICDSGSDSDSRPRCAALRCVVPPPLAHTSLTRSSSFHTPSRGKKDPRAPARGLAPRHTLRPQYYSQRWHCRMDDGARGLSRFSAKRVPGFFRSVTQRFINMRRADVLPLYTSHTQLPVMHTHLARFRRLRASPRVARTWSERLAPLNASSA